jgi:hypothetical protein
MNFTADNVDGRQSPILLSRDEAEVQVRFSATLSTERRAPLDRWHFCLLASSVANSRQHLLTTLTQK